MSKNRIKAIKQSLKSTISQCSQTRRCLLDNPEKNFTRNRKMNLEDLIYFMINMGGNTLSQELLNHTSYSTDTMSNSAFVQQRYKIPPQLFKEIFYEFTKLHTPTSSTTLKVLAVDGSDLYIPKNEDDEDSYTISNPKGKGYNLYHINALFNVNTYSYEAIRLQKMRQQNERTALTEMLQELEDGNFLILADRGYEAWNNLAHIQNKKGFFLFRIRNGKTGIIAGLDLPQEETFDQYFELHLCRRQTKEMRKKYENKNRYKFISASTEFDFLKKINKKSDPYEEYILRFRLVRFPISEQSFEMIITNLSSDDYPIQKVKSLYHQRWGIETSFNQLKYSIGLTHFHSKKMRGIEQEIYARFIRFNLCSFITKEINIGNENKKKKYTYKLNFTILVVVIQKYMRSMITEQDLMYHIKRDLVPIRQGRKSTRQKRQKYWIFFTYRVP